MSQIRWHGLGVVPVIPDGACPYGMGDFQQEPREVEQAGVACPGLACLFQLPCHLWVCGDSGAQWAEWPAPCAAQGGLGPESWGGSCPSQGPSCGIC